MQGKMLSQGKREIIQRDCFAKLYFWMFGGNQLFLPEWCYRVSATGKSFRINSKGGRQWYLLTVCQNTSCYGVIRFQASGVRLRQESMNDLLGTPRCLFSVCLSLCTGMHMQVPVEVRKGYQIHRRWSYRQL